MKDILKVQSYSSMEISNAVRKDIFYEQLNADQQKVLKADIEFDDCAKFHVLFRRKISKQLEVQSRVQQGYIPLPRLFFFDIGVASDATLSKRYEGPQWAMTSLLKWPWVWGRSWSQDKYQENQHF